MLDRGVAGANGALACPTVAEGPVGALEGGNKACADIIGAGGDKAARSTALEAVADVHEAPVIGKRTSRTGRAPEGVGGGDEGVPVAALDGGGGRIRACAERDDRAGSAALEAVAGVLVAPVIHAGAPDVLAAALVVAGGRVEACVGGIGRANPMAPRWTAPKVVADVVGAPVVSVVASGLRAPEICV